MNGWMNRWVDGWMDGWVDGWMDGWMHGWMDGWMDEYPDDSLINSLIEIGLIILFIAVDNEIMKVMNINENLISLYRANFITTRHVKSDTLEETLLNMFQ